MNSTEKKKNIRNKEDDAVIKAALQKKLKALRTLKALEGEYESTEIGDKTREKRIKAYVALYEAEKVLEAFK